MSERASSANSDVDPYVIIWMLLDPVLNERKQNGHTRNIVEHTGHLKRTIFWDITACSPVRFNRRFGGTYRLHLQGWKISLARNRSEDEWQASYSSTLKMEAICSSETSLDTQRTTRRYIPEDGTLHNHRCENLKSYMVMKLQIS
jgi:hypothetical protein